MITIDEAEFERILNAHSDTVDAIDRGEYRAGYLAAISDAMTALKAVGKLEATE